MAIEQLKVHEIVKSSVSKSVDIPEFQREFVWDPQQVKLLAESLYRDYPIGSFLLWDSSDYQEAKVAQGAKASQWIVDGQQRTTELSLLLGQKPYWWDSAETWNKALKRYDVMANVLSERKDDRIEFALANPIRKRDARWVSVREILRIEKVEDLTPITQEIVRKISSEVEGNMELFPTIHSRLVRIWQLRERDIPIVKINHEVEDVAEIFARLNQAGTRVKEADVILALAAVRNPGWVRKKYLPFCGDLEDRGWDLDAGIFIRTMTGVGKGRARLIEVPKDFWRPENLETIWKRSSIAISDVLKRFAEFGILSPDLLPSTNSLIPLFVLHERWAEGASYSFKKALWWFLLANWDGRYSGAAITSLNEDVKSIFEASTFEEAITKLASRLQVEPKLSGEEFLNRYDRAGNRFLRLMLYLILYDNAAPDWVDGSLLGYDKTGSPITSGFQPQWHHIFPRSILKKEKKYSDDDINALANITVLNERTNVKKISAKYPWQYITEFTISPEALRRHAIPPNFIPSSTGNLEKFKAKWAIENYTDFLIERAEILAEMSSKFLEELAK